MEDEEMTSRPSSPEQEVEEPSQVVEPEVPEEGHEEEQDVSDLPGVSPTEHRHNHEEQEGQEDAVEEAVEEAEEEEAEEEAEEEVEEAEDHVDAPHDADHEEAEAEVPEQAMLAEGDEGDAPAVDRQEDEVAEEDAEEEEEEVEAEEYVEDDAPGGQEEAESWPALPSSRPAAPRRWTGRAAQEPVLDTNEDEEEEEEEEEMEEEEWYDEEMEEEVENLRMQMRQMEEENESLRDELSQEKTRVKQLQKLQVEAAQAAHREFEAKKREAAALRELEEAKAYVSKRHTFALNDKAELMKKVADLERKLQEAADRELALRLEVQEAVQAQSSSSTQQEDFHKEAERWRKDAAEQATRVKAAEQRAQQLEQRKTEDKAKIKALADQLKLATAAGFVAEANPDEKRPQDSSKSKAPGAPVAAAKVTSSKGPNGRGIVNKPLEPRKPAVPSRPWYRRFAGFCGRQISWAMEATAKASAPAAKSPQKVSKGKRPAPIEKAAKTADPVQADSAEFRQGAVLAFLVLFIACLAVSKLAR